MERNANVMEYKSNIQNVILKLENKLKDAKEISVLQRNIGTYLLASNLRRIHNDGISVLGTRIGDYDSKNPIYINPKNSPKAFEPIGKPVKGTREKKKTGQKQREGGKRGAFSFIVKKDQAGQYYKHKTRWFPSYRNYRQYINRDVSVVNLQLSGRLKLSWVMEQQGNDLVLGFNSKYGSDVSRGNEQRFKKRIWGVTQKDNEEIEKLTKDFISKINA